MSQPPVDQALQVPAAIAAVSSAVGVAVTDNTVYWLGVPMPVVLASLCGASVALSILGSMTRPQAFSAVALGTATGTYVPKLLAWKYGVPPDVLPAVGFILGIGAHIGLSALFGATPGALSKFLDAAIERFKGGKS